MSRSLTRLSVLLAAVFVFAHGATAQDSSNQQGFGVCRPVAQRTTDLGCWILTDNAVGELKAGKTYWHLDRFPTREAAEQAKVPTSTIVEAFHQYWLMTLGPKDWHPASKGEHVSDIGPLPIHPDRKYSAMFMETVMTPGMTSAIHTHSGPEAWYTISGETCLETSQGKVVGRPNSPAIVPEGPAMHLTATGHEQRRGITMILHDASKPPTTIEHEWKPKGLCKVQ